MGDGHFKVCEFSGSGISWLLKIEGVWYRLFFTIEEDEGLESLRGVHRWTRDEMKESRKTDRTRLWSAATGIWDSSCAERRRRRSRFQGKGFLCWTDCCMIEEKTDRELRLTATLNVPDVFCSFAAWSREIRHHTILPATGIDKGLALTLVHCVAQQHRTQSSQVPFLCCKLSTHRLLSVFYVLCVWRVREREATLLPEASIILSINESILSLLLPDQWIIAFVSTFFYLWNACSSRLWSKEAIIAKRFPLFPLLTTHYTTTRLTDCWSSGQLIGWTKNKNTDKQ